MASTRLNNELRRVVRRRILEHAFGKRRQEFAIKEYALGDRLYDHLHTPKQKEAMRALPEEFFKREDHISVSIDGQYHKIDLRESRIVSYHAACHRTAFSSSTPLGSDLLSFVIEKQKLTDEERRAGKNAWAVLESCHTVSGLIKTWPEVAEFCKDLEKSPTPTCTALALNLPALNLELGLPPDAAVP